MLASMLRYICVLFLSAAFCAAQQPEAKPAPAPGSPADLAQQADKLRLAGKLDEALALYEQALDKAPEAFDAQMGEGVVLDLKGEYAQAEKHFARAIEHAPADSRQTALRAMAFSYAFQGNAFKASESEMQVLNARFAKSDSVGAAEICNELARIYLESDDPDHAYKWYKMGYDTVAHKPDLSLADKSLWQFRWENAQARIAARRGLADEAHRHVAAAKAALDKAENPEQARFYPYLTGYVAFYTGDYKTAITEFQKADQHDPLVLALLGEAYEKSGDAAQAKELYRKVLDINTHNPANAFARPLAKKKLAGS